MTRPASATRPVQSRSIQRRQEIVEAALRLFARDGVAAVTHRAIAIEAGVPLAATTYYFSTKSDLLAAAFRLHAEQETERIKAKLIGLAELADTPIKLANRLADFVIEGLTTNREQLVAEYQLLVEGSRDDQLGNMSRSWLNGLYETVETALRTVGSARPDVDAKVVLATLAGLEVDHLDTVPSDDEQRSIRSTLRRLITVLTRDHSQ